ncbi:Glutathione synthase [Alteripontixanthobacter maritimus]|uniref:Glutathione synthase n=1 Tax=Alteripontixanthobacter maritimus TaxID=2161824 RepID=A0A369Q2F0_9SPHN|nr:DUF1704 domain-containing protein [Alteripontixanthobacter maritimus]RDC58944.1 Glutathione synthase [Alteripontixanthobacter maritimus]
MARIFRSGGLAKDAIYLRGFKAVLNILAARGSLKEPRLRPEFLDTENTHARIAAFRSNIHAGGKAEAVEITETELKVAELIRPRLVADGMFLVGVDIVGDKILEVNVFSPGNLKTCNEMAGVNFAVPIIESVERKVQAQKENLVPFSNQVLATM